MNGSLSVLASDLVNTVAKAAGAESDGVEILGEARRSVSIASFYFSRQGDGKDAAAPAGLPDRLAPLVKELPVIGAQGVQVRVLGDGKFFGTYPEALTWLDEQPGVEARHIDAGGHQGEDDEAVEEIRHAQRERHA